MTNSDISTIIECNYRSMTNTRNIYKKGVVRTLHAITKVKCINFYSTSLNSLNGTQCVDSVSCVKTGSVKPYSPTQVLVTGCIGGCIFVVSPN